MILLYARRHCLEYLLRFYPIGIHLKELDNERLEIYGQSIVEFTCRKQNHQKDLRYSVYPPSVLELILEPFEPNQSSDSGEADDSCRNMNLQ